MTTTSILLLAPLAILLIFAAVFAVSLGATALAVVLVERALDALARLAFRSRVEVREAVHAVVAAEAAVVAEVAEALAASPEPE